MTVHLTSNRKGTWTYSPPIKAIRAGVVQGWVFEGSKQTAHYRAQRDNKLILQWRRGKLVGTMIDDKSNLSQIAAHYMNTAHYLNLSVGTQSSYRYWFQKVCADFPNISITKIDTAKCSQVYDQWVQESIPGAAIFVRAFSILVSHAISHGIVQVNPMAYVKKVTHRPDTTIWTQEQVNQFVKTAFSRFDWRSMGVIALLCYEFAQRPNDIANLKWESIDWDKRQITIAQSKRGVTVYVPISDELMAVLRDQYQDFKFQSWVAPQLRVDNAYRPYTRSLMSTHFHNIRVAAGLPKDLKIGKLRNTALTEMVEAGVDIANIKQVSGHRNISSLNPYIKNTLKGSSTALNKRKEYQG